MGRVGACRICGVEFDLGRHNAATCKKPECLKAIAAIRRASRPTRSKPRATTMDDREETLARLAELRQTRPRPVTAKFAAEFRDLYSHGPKGELKDDPWT